MNDETCPYYRRFEIIAPNQCYRVLLECRITMAPPGRGLPSVEKHITYYISEVSRDSGHLDISVRAHIPQNDISQGRHNARAIYTVFTYWKNPGHEA